jgi:outer membrane biosynthesis protein TonB
LLVSFAVHAAILLFGLVVLPNPSEHKISEPPPIAVNIEDFQDVAKRANQTTEPVEQERKPDEPPKVQKVEKKIDKPAPKPAKEVKQAAREPQAQPEAKPEPKPEPPKPAETQPDPKPLEELIKKTQDVSPDPKPQQEQQARSVPKPRVKPAPPKKVEAPKKKQDEFKLDDIAALLNKTDDEKASPSDQTETGTPLVGDQNLTGNDEQVTATALDWLRQRVGQCWSIPAGARDAGKLVVTLRFQLDIDGRIVGQPFVERTTSHPAAAAAASSAMAALIQCQPYDRMPKETHHLWADIRMNFDPSVMVGLN